VCVGARTRTCRVPRFRPSSACTTEQSSWWAGNAVQGPATVVHNDYTVAAAPRRLEQLATRADSANSTLPGGAALVPPGALAAAKRGGRWAMINVWRNILPEGEAVAHTPLAVVDGASVKFGTRPAPEGCRSLASRLAVV
jgi:hypothetical protein